MNTLVRYETPSGDDAVDLCPACERRVPSLRDHRGNEYCNVAMGRRAAAGARCGHPAHGEPADAVWDADAWAWRGCASIPEDA